MRFLCLYLVLASFLASGCLSRRADRSSYDDDISDGGNDSDITYIPQDSSISRFNCGNNVLDPGEQCDGPGMFRDTCASLNMGNTGVLVCTLDCRYDTSMCYYDNRPFFDGGRFEGGIQLVDSGNDTHVDDAGDDDGGVDPSEREVVRGGCARSMGATCSSDRDCATGGCGGELCYNPSFGWVTTSCDCSAPTNLSCGCVNGSCTWWR